MIPRRIYKFDETRSGRHLLKRSRLALANNHGSTTQDKSYCIIKTKSTSLMFHNKVSSTETLTKKQRNVGTTDNLISPKLGEQTSIIVADSSAKPMSTNDSNGKEKDGYSDISKTVQQSSERPLLLVNTSEKKQKTLSETIFLTDFTVPSKRARYDYKVETSGPSHSGSKSAVVISCNKSKQLLKDQHLKKPYLGLLVKKISGENLDCDYIQLLDKKASDTLYKKCENEIEYFTGDLAKVKVFGKWFDVPRKQVAYGDNGLTYTYSGNTVPALTWPPFLKDLRDHLKLVTGVYFSFVLVNRYADGKDYIGEHKDNEKELNKLSPIASISLGQTRLFRLRHGDSRGKNSKRNIEPVSVDLKHGTLLMINYPTNQYWYHSLPKRHSIKFPRINLTFRDLKIKIP